MYLEIQITNYNGLVHDLYAYVEGHQKYLNDLNRYLERHTERHTK